ncbi:hypothetical protein ACFV8Z_42570 [Streptomyces sp. NPDC059837]|uniref:hypothetical protein n=1 Tax=unclassified Streptomyces TaxID=2593676 RepID=UPI0022590CF1|nr:MULTISPECIES: hypothetical protein [unclassified Streptomyces]MCX4402399.1 hypothetical protein [Streptomyces sp. NBC_01764]MCX5182754.1 hypothetical protein [Streptomyces sp. NBC_00268]
MTLSTATAAPDAVIIDYNGVIGLQPEADQWRHLARLAARGRTSLTNERHRTEALLSTVALRVR